MIFNEEPLCRHMWLHKNRNQTRFLALGVKQQEVFPILASMATLHVNMAVRSRVLTGNATMRASVRHYARSAAAGGGDAPGGGTGTAKKKKRGSGVGGYTKSNTIMIFASEVPVISALNPFRKIEDVFFDVWKRTNPTQITKLQEDLQLLLPTPEEKIQAIVRDLGVEAPIASLLEEAAEAETTTKVVATTMKIASALPKDTPVEVKQEIVQFVSSEMHKSFGSKQETPAIEHYEQKQQVAVRERNLVFSKKKLATLGNYDVFVGGKIDGKAEGKVIEVKNRLKKFMTPLPQYDIAQLQTYLFILGLQEGELVEHLRNDAAQTKLTKVDWDPQMWETQISPFVLRFSSALVHFMKNDDAQVGFLQGEAGEKKEIIRTHWVKDLP